MKYQKVIDFLDNTLKEEGFAVQHDREIFVLCGNKLSR